MQASVPDMVGFDRVVATDQHPSYLIADRSKYKSENISQKCLLWQRDFRYDKEVPKQKSGISANPGQAHLPNALTCVACHLL
jgi:hypothetical protein